MGDEKGGRSALSLSPLSLARFYFRSRVSTFSSLTCVHRMSQISLDERKRSENFVGSESVRMRE